MVAAPDTIPAQEIRVRLKSLSDSVDTLEEGVKHLETINSSFQRIIRVRDSLIHEGQAQALKEQNDQLKQLADHLNIAVSDIVREVRRELNEINRITLELVPGKRRGIAKLRDMKRYDLHAERELEEHKKVFLNNSILKIPFVEGRITPGDLLFTGGNVANYNMGFTKKGKKLFIDINLDNSMRQYYNPGEYRWRIEYHNKGVAQVIILNASGGQRIELDWEKFDGGVFYVVAYATPDTIGESEIIPKGYKKNDFVYAYESDEFVIS